jgi:hypothetical protein
MNLSAKWGIEVIFSVPSKITLPLGVFGRVLPKLGFAYGLRNNMVIRGGWTLSSAVGTQLGGTNAWSQTTEYNSTPDDRRLFDE